MILLRDGVATAVQFSISVSSAARRHHHLTTTKNQELQQKHLILNITVECINGRFKGLYLSDNYRRWWQVTTGTPLPLYSLLLRSRNTV
ncbi:uncharacterized protein LOC142592785 isoform X4 [Dermacentor variabilis]|uniref:uncharacterized protein LOC142592785 isoform X4 n=1 Tax=Dermacentor variabilis TaxID=34621 RepID=UPI003F5BD31F